MIVGLTGGIGSGKSTVAQYFRDCGVQVIDTDNIAKQLLESNQPFLQEAVKHFGEKILHKNGLLDRIALKTLVFETPADRHWLEALLHPRIKEKVLEYTNAEKFKNRKQMSYLIVEIPLLIEANFEDIVDRILVIDCPVNLQIERIQKRDKTPIHVIQQIIQAQVDRNTRLQKADDVIENTEGLEALKNKILTLHRYYIELSKSFLK